MMARTVAAIAAIIVSGSVLLWEILSQFSLVEWMLDKLRSSGPTGRSVASLIARSEFRMFLAIVGILIATKALAGQPAQLQRIQAKLRKECIVLARELFAFLDERRKLEPPDARLIGDFRAENMRLYNDRFPPRVRTLIEHLRRNGHMDAANSLVVAPGSLFRIEEMAAKIRKIGEEIE